MSPLNITQPLGIWSIMATIRWCPIFPKWDSYQPLDCFFLFLECLHWFKWFPWNTLLHHPRKNHRRSRRRTVWPNTFPTRCWQMHLSAERCATQPSPPRATEYKDVMMYTSYQRSENSDCVFQLYSLHVSAVSYLFVINIHRHFVTITINVKRLWT